MSFYESTSHPQIKKYEAKRTGATRYLVRYRTDQGRLTMKRGFGTMREAKAFLAEQQTAKAAGTFVAQSAGAVTIGELATPWLAHKAAVQSRSYADALDASWRTHVEARWAHVVVSRVQTSAVRDWSPSSPRPAQRPLWPARTASSPGSSTSPSRTSGSPGTPPAA